MVALRIDWPHDQSVDANSAVRSGAKFYVYQNETTTAVTLYSDRDGLVTRANPVVADSAGNFPVVYVASTSLLTLTLKTSADVTLESWDDIEPEVSTDLTELANYVARAGGNTYRMTGPFEEKEATALVAATSIDLDAMTGSWGHVTGNTAISTLTLAQGSRRTLIFDGTPTLAHSASLLLGGADITVHAGMILVFAGEGSGVTRLIGGMTASGRSIVESVAIIVGIGDETTAITAGTNKRRIRSPFAFKLTGARTSLASAQASGDLVAVDVNNAGNSVFSTVLTIDNNETTSTTADTPCVINTDYDDIADDALLAFDIDDCDGSTAAAGLKVTLLGYRFNTQ
jgi:hypothetical protein